MGLQQCWVQGGKSSQQASSWLNLLLWQRKLDSHLPRNGGPELPSSKTLDLCTIWKRNYEPVSREGAGRALGSATAVPPSFTRLVSEGPSCFKLHFSIIRNVGVFPHFAWLFNILSFVNWLFKYFTPFSIFKLTFMSHLYIQDSNP